MKRSSSKTSDECRLGFECLEPREMMAVASIYDPVQGMLTLNGSNAAETVQVAQSSTGSYSVTGFNGTAISGTASVPVIKSLRLNLAGGADSFSFYGKTYSTTTPRPFIEIIVDAGAGQNNITIDRFYGTGGITVNSGNHNDAVAIRNSVANAVVINAGEGNNDVDVTDATIFGALTVNSEIGNDEISFRNLKVDVVNVTAGAGDDVIRLNDVEGASALKVRDMVFAAGKGDDEFYVYSVDAKKAKFAGGLGVDSIDFAFSSIHSFEVTGMESVD